MTRQELVKQLQRAGLNGDCTLLITEHSVRLMLNDSARPMVSPDDLTDDIEAHLGVLLPSMFYAKQIAGIAGTNLLVQLWTQSPTVAVCVRDWTT